MSNEKSYSSLNLDNAVKAGWFQWYDIKEYIEYPECHVLTYKLTNNCFYSQVLDIDIVASGTTAIDSFGKVNKLALNFFKEYKKQDGKINFQPKGAAYWDKFRELYHENKLRRFLSQNSTNNKKNFPFQYVDEAEKVFRVFEFLKEAITIIDKQQDAIAKQKSTMKEQKDKIAEQKSTMEEQKDKIAEQQDAIAKQKSTIGILQAKIRELDNVGVSVKESSPERLEADY